MDLQFTFVFHKVIPNNNVFIYTWLENEIGEESNRTYYTLNNLFKLLELRIIVKIYKYLHLYYDSYPKQKNRVSMAALLKSYNNSNENHFRELFSISYWRYNNYLSTDKGF